MLQLINHIFSEYSPWLVFLGLWVDSVFAPAPGETLLVAGSFYLNLKSQPLWNIYLLGVLGAWCGSYTSYLIGIRLGDSELPILKRLGITKPRVARVSSLMEKYGLWILVFSRFIPGSRQVVYYMAGLGKMKGLKFHTATLAGILPWAGLAVYLGAFVGDNWDRAVKMLHSYGLLIGIAGGVLLIGYILWQKYFRSYVSS